MKNVIKRLLTGGLLFTVLLAISGCEASENKTNGEEKPIIAVSIVPQKTFVEAVCKDHFEVITLIPPGSSPESYEPSPMEMEEFSKSLAYFTVGVAAEEANILPAAKGINVISLQDEVSLVYQDRLFDNQERDPHIWLSPKRVIVMIETITREIVELDPSNRDFYEKNAKEYIDQLNALDQEILGSLSNIKNKKMIVYHPAFGYLADDYGITMYSLEEEGKESTPKHLEEIIDLAKKENIRVIFYQEEIDSSQSKAFAEEIGGITVQLSPLAENYIENLQEMAQTIAEAME